MVTYFSSCILSWELFPHFPLKEVPLNKLPYLFHVTFLHIIKEEDITIDDLRTVY